MRLKHIFSEFLNCFRLRVWNLVLLNGCRHIVGDLCKPRDRMCSVNGIISFRCFVISINVMSSYWKWDLNDLLKSWHIVTVLRSKVLWLRSYEFATSYSRFSRCFAFLTWRCSRLLLSRCLHSSFPYSTGVFRFFVKAVDWLFTLHQGWDIPTEILR